MTQILRLSTLMAALVGQLLLTGCGNKGDLYIPEPPPEQTQAGDAR